MLTLAPVLSILDPGNWMVALDLQDAYFHISVLPAHLRYLQFTVGHEHFQFTVLPIGLNSAPRVFTKVMTVVAAHLRRSEVPVSHLQTRADLLHSLAFTINVPKSHLTPSQKLLFIGAVPTAQFQVYPPEQQVRDIRAMIPMFHPLSRISVRMTLRLLGLLLPAGGSGQMAYVSSAVGPEVPVGATSGESFRCHPDLGGDCKSFAVMAHEPGLGQQQIPIPSPTRDRSSDGCVTSGMGWPHGRGGDQIYLVSGGVWALHQPYGELQAIRLALKAFLPSVKGRVVQVFTDNTTAMWYCLLTWLELQGISLVVLSILGRFPGHEGGLTQPPVHDGSRMASSLRGGAKSLSAVGRALIKSIHH
ncbi:uncharacterized protein LOC144823449 [Lissotriton helveticus]